MISDEVLAVAVLTKLNGEVSSRPTSSKKGFDISQPKISPTSTMLDREVGSGPTSPRAS